jgi:hypothetical protein
MGTSYPKETLISLANLDKRKLQYRPRTYGTPCSIISSGLVVVVVSHRLSLHATVYERSLGSEVHWRINQSVWNFIVNLPLLFPPCTCHDKITKFREKPINCLIRAMRTGNRKRQCKILLYCNVYYSCREVSHLANMIYRSVFRRSRCSYTFILQMNMQRSDRQASHPPPTVWAFNNGGACFHCSLQSTQHAAAAGG